MVSGTTLDHPALDQAKGSLNSKKPTQKNQEVPRTNYCGQGLREVLIHRVTVSGAMILSLIVVDSWLQASFASLLSLSRAQTDQGAVVVLNDSPCCVKCTWPDPSPELGSKCCQSSSVNACMAWAQFPYKR